MCGFVFGCVFVGVCVCLRVSVRSRVFVCVGARVSLCVGASGFVNVCLCGSSCVWMRVWCVCVYGCMCGLVR